MGKLAELVVKTYGASHGITKGDVYVVEGKKKRAYFGDDDDGGGGGGGGGEGE